MAFFRYFGTFFRQNHQKYASKCSKTAENHDVFNVQGVNIHYFSFQPL